MAYSAITNAEIDQDSPITQTLMTKYRDNIILAAEGIWHPYDRTEPDGSADGVFYDFSTDGAVASVETPNFADGYDYLIILDNMTTSAAANRSLEIELYRDTDAAYSGATTPASTFFAPSSPGGWGYIQLMNPKGWSRAAAEAYYNVRLGVSTRSEGFADTQDTTIQTVGKVRLGISADNIDGGKMMLLRRKTIWGL